MPVRPIIPSIESNSDAKNKLKIKDSNPNQEVSFQGLGTAVVPIMDAVDRGGFAGAFILQDFLGMAAPRVGAGILRNHDKTGQYNWDFAKREGIREILSGPSAFFIPAGMIWGIKKLFGSANNVPIDFIKVFSDTFKDYAISNKEILAQPEARKNIYKEMFKNILTNSLDGKLSEVDLEKYSESFANQLEVISDKNLSHRKAWWKILLGKPDTTSRQDKTAALVNEFVELRKEHLGLDVDAYGASYKTASKQLESGLKNILSYMKDYTNDALKTINKALGKTADLDLNEFFKTFSRSRSGSRMLSNISMYAMVVLFFTIIPKLYNSVIRGSRDPGLDGLGVGINAKPSNNPTFGKPESAQEQVLQTKEDSSEAPQSGSQPAFTGLGSKAMASIGKIIEKNPNIKANTIDVLEFNDASMKPLAMLYLLFGFCLPPRITNAKSKYDLKEIIYRDLTSFAAILFAGKALARGFSKISSKVSGLVLSKTPVKHSTILEKLKNYFWLDGIKVFESPDIIAKYSGIRNVKGGFNEFLSFIDKNGGNVQKVLADIDSTVATAAETIIGKPIKEASTREIFRAFKNAKTTHPEEMETIFKAFDSSENKFVNSAKATNSWFNLISNLALVPMLMIYLAKSCERMTANAVARDKERNKKFDIPQTASFVPTNKPSMAGFLDKKTA